MLQFTNYTLLYRCHTRTSHTVIAGTVVYYVSCHNKDLNQYFHGTISNVLAKDFKLFCDVYATLVQLIGRFRHRDNFAACHCPSCPTKNCIFLFGKSPFKTSHKFCFIRYYIWCKFIQTLQEWSIPSVVGHTINSLHFTDFFVRIMAQ